LPELALRELRGPPREVDKTAQPLRVLTDPRPGDSSKALIPTGADLLAQRLPESEQTRALPRGGVARPAPFDRLASRDRIEPDSVETAADSKDLLQVDLDLPALAFRDQIDLVEDKEEPGGVARDLREELDLLGGDRGVRGEHEDRQVGPRQHGASCRRVGLVGGADPRAVDERHPLRPIGQRDRDLDPSHATTIAGVLAFGDVLRNVRERDWPHRAVGLGHPHALRTPNQVSGDGGEGQEAAGEDIASGKGVEEGGFASLELTQDRHRELPSREGACGRRNLGPDLGLIYRLGDLAELRELRAERPDRPRFGTGRHWVHR